MPGLTLKLPGGSFYALIGCAGLIGALTPDADFTAYLLKAAGIAAVPGCAYELCPFFRISTSASEAMLNTAMDRKVAAVAKLKGPAS